MDQKPLSSEKTVALVLNAHRDPGPGMLESLYEYSFACELDDDEIPHAQQAFLPAPSCNLGKRCRTDLLINGKMIVEVKGIAPPA